MQYVPEIHNKYSNGIYFPPPNYNVRGPDFWSAGILSPEVNRRYAAGQKRVGKNKSEPQFRFSDPITTVPIKPSKYKYGLRDSIFANFGMIGGQPTMPSSFSDASKAKQANDAGVIMGGSRQGTRKVKPKGKGRRVKQK